jgi:hypothetical protein
VGKLTRVARTAAATITHLFEVDETATDPAGNAATVAFTDANGTAVTSGAGTRVSTGLYSFVLPGQASLAGLTAAWTGTIGGSTVTELDYVQIVGGYFFGLAEARADDSSWPTPPSTPPLTCWPAAPRSRRNAPRSATGRSCPSTGVAW